MTPRQQLFAALTGEPLDRHPAWLLFPWNKIGCYVDVRTHPAYRPIHERSQGQVIILNRHRLEAPLLVDPMGVPERLVTDEDLERFAAAEIETDPDRIAAALDKQLPQYLADRAAFPADYGSMMLSMGEPIGPVHQREQMRVAVHELRDRFAGKRLIISPTAGPFDPDPPQRLIDNYHAFLDAALD